jgi:transcriptional regulator with XRE-family HTH domain
MRSEPSAPLALSLRELRSYTGMTQVEAASAHGMTQSELSRLEHRDDFLVSTLRRYAAALGGEVDVVVRLGSTSIVLTDGAHAPAPPDPERIAQAIEGLAGLERWLTPVLAHVTPALATERRPGCGTFALVEHICHLRDLDREGFGVRVARMRRETDPVIDEIDGDRWAAERGYERADLRRTLRSLLAVRAGLVTTLREIAAPEWARTAKWSGRVVSLGELVCRWYTHDVGHRVEIEKLAEALTTGA